MGIISWKPRWREVPSESHNVDVTATAATARGGGAPSVVKGCQLSGGRDDGGFR